MSSLDRSVLACDQAIAHILSAASVIPIPRLRDRGVIRGKASVTAKQQIDTRNHVVKPVLQSGMLLGRLGIPPIKECEDGSGYVRVNAVQDGVMQFPATVKALLRALGFSLAIHTQYVSRMVTKEI